jgi:hypothetical protein
MSLDYIRDTYGVPTEPVQPVPYESMTQGTFHPLGRPDLHVCPRHDFDFVADPKTGCPKCNAAPKPTEQSATQAGAGERYREQCAKGGRCLQGCLKAEQCFYAAPTEPAQPSREFLVPDAVWEALQRMIEDGVRRGPASREDAKAVADWRGRFWKKAEPAQPATQAGAGPAGPHLRKQAANLLRGLDANRPRRALDLDALRRLLELIAEPSKVEMRTAELIRAAWEWGVSCEVDDVRWGEAGDSHNEMMRDRTTEAATRLQASICTAPGTEQPATQAGAAEQAMTNDQIRSLWQMTDTGDVEDDILTFSHALLNFQAATTEHKIIADFLERTGQYVTNDATRDAAIADAVAKSLAAPTTEQPGAPIAYALRFDGDSRLNLSTVFDTQEEAESYAERCSQGTVVVPLAEVATEQPGDAERLRAVANIAHAGGLQGMSEGDALTAIRRLTIDHWTAHGKGGE